LSSSTSVYVCTGKLYKDIQAHVRAAERKHWQRIQKGKHAWDYLEFVRPEAVLYTNLGMGAAIDQQLKEAGYEHLLQTESIVALAHGRGADELVHRTLKNFACQTLPFKKFAHNAAFYYTMLTAFFLFECFKEDVCSEVVPIESYPTMLRRKVIDLAAKIVRTSGKIILKVTQAAMGMLCSSIGSGTSQLTRRSLAGPEASVVAAGISYLPCR
jgi:hypothetical protein